MEAPRNKVTCTGLAHQAGAETCPRPPFHPGCQARNSTLLCSVLEPTVPSVATLLPSLRHRLKVCGSGILLLKNAGEHLQEGALMCLNIQVVLRAGTLSLKFHECFEQESALHWMKKKCLHMGMFQVSAELQDDSPVPVIWDQDWKWLQNYHTEKSPTLLREWGWISAGQRAATKTQRHCQTGSHLQLAFGRLRI